jgi:nicotinamide-nucleotide amidase
MANLEDSLTRVSLLLIGDELTTGAINDTNGKWLSEKLTELGLSVIGLEIVRDRIDEIVPAIKRAAFRAEVVITTGGLGPTTDDITRDAFAKYLGVELVENQSSLDKILARYAQRGVPMNPISARQAMFPKTATIINNSVGTADSFSCELLEGKKSIAFSLPGVPMEMKRIFEEELFPVLKNRFPKISKPNAAYLRCFGLSESAVGSAIEKASIGEQFVVGYRPVYPEVWVKISGVSLSAKECEEAAAKAAEVIGLDHIVSNSFEIPSSKIVLELLKDKNLTVAFAESCSGGMASSLLVNEPGASAVFSGSIVCYSNEIKINEVNVKRQTINDYGAVSSETALELARGIREKFKTSIGVSITGIAGPDGGNPEKPAGTVFLGYSTEARQQVVSYTIQFERNRFRTYTAYAALDLIRRDLLGHPLQFVRR